MGWPVLAILCACRSREKAGRLAGGVERREQGEVKEMHAEAPLWWAGPDTTREKNGRAGRERPRGRR